MRIPSSANTASKPSVNLVSRSADQELELPAPLGQVDQDVAGGLGCPLSGWMGGHAGQVCPTGPVLDEDQGVQAFQSDRVYMHEVDGENAVGLGGEELLPCRARTPRCRIQPGRVQDLPHRRGSDLVAELDQLALDAAMAPQRIVLRHGQHELLDRRGSRRPAGFPPGAVVPLAGDQPAVPGQHRRRAEAGTPAPNADAGSAMRGPRTRTGRPTRNGLCGFDGAGLHSRGAAPAVQRPWTRHYGTRRPRNPEHGGLHGTQATRTSGQDRSSTTTGQPRPGHRPDRISEPDRIPVVFQGRWSCRSCRPQMVPRRESGAWPSDS